jgi:hypothetical protein
MGSDFTVGQVVLRGILKQEGMTINTLGTQLGMDRSQALYDIDRGKTQTISTRMAEKILASFPHYSRSWLLSGEGEMLKHPTKASSETAEATQKPHRAPQEVEGIASGSRVIQRLPIIPIEAQAGIGKGFLYDVDPSQDPEDIYDEFDSMEVVLEREVSDRYKLFRVKGDSMTDGTLSSICTGDVLLCREVFPEDWKLGLTNNRYPNVVIVIEEEGILIKQLIKHSKKNETISLHSINPKYNDFTVDLKNVRAFYYVERIVDRHMSQW